MQYSVKIIKWPKEEDWLWAKTCCLNTVGKKVVNAPDSEWKHKLLASEHSPIRELWFGFELIIPYYLSTHYVRHGTFVNHYVQSQRNDRQDKYDRTKAPQDAPVSHIISLNAQDLMNMSHRRLCNQADNETRTIMKEMCRQAIEKCPELDGLLVPMCEYRGGLCTEFNCCGHNYYIKNRQ